MSIPIINRITGPSTSNYSLESRHQSLRYFKDKDQNLCRICGKPRKDHPQHEGKFTFCQENKND